MDAFALILNGLEKHGCEDMIENYAMVEFLVASIHMILGLMNLIPCGDYNHQLLVSCRWMI